MRYKSLSFEAPKGFVLAACVSAALVAGSFGAQAGPITYSNTDDGAPTTGPFPNSDAAQTTFLAAAATFGPVVTETFEELPANSGLPSGTPFAMVGGASGKLNTPFVYPYSGVQNVNSGNLYGFNITPGGKNWLGFANGSFTVSFAGTGTNSFGFFTTGVQSIFTDSIDVTFVDGKSEDLSLPVNVNGGASYFGFTDKVAIKSVTITNLGNDAWGIDDVSYNAIAVKAVPEASTWAMLFLGFAGIGFLSYRRKNSYTLRIV